VFGSHPIGCSAASSDARYPAYMNRIIFFASVKANALIDSEIGSLTNAEKQRFSWHNRTASRGFARRHGLPARPDPTIIYTCLEEKAMKRVGFILIALGVCGLVYAMNLDTTVEISRQSIGLHFEARDNSLDSNEDALNRSESLGESSTFTPSARVHNLGLIFHKISWLLVSSVILVSGVLFYGFGFLGGQKSRNEQRDTRITRKTPQQPAPSLLPRERRRSGRLRVAEQTNPADAAKSSDARTMPLPDPQNVRLSIAPQSGPSKTCKDVDSLTKPALGIMPESTSIAGAADSDLHGVLKEIKEISEAGKDIKGIEIENIL
jgi:hypothetical protein